MAIILIYMTTPTNRSEDHLIDKTFLELRKIVKTQGKYVMRKLFLDYVTGPYQEKVVPACIICGTHDNITKEHVLPRWIYDNNPRYSFKILVNELNQDFIKATVPACCRCNSELLNNVERYIQQTLSTVDFTSREYSRQEISNIIRWLEIIDYKFHVWQIIAKFIRHKKIHYVSDIADFSIAFMKEGSIRAITSKTRLALKRVATKNKAERINSLFACKTIEKKFAYFHSYGNFVQVQIPSYDKMFFYFIQKKHRSNKTAIKEAVKIINQAIYSHPTPY